MLYLYDGTNGKAMCNILNVDILYYHERVDKKGCLSIVGSTVIVFVLCSSDCNMNTYYHSYKNPLVLVKDCSFFNKDKK